MSQTYITLEQSDIHIMWINSPRVRKIVMRTLRQLYPRDGIWMNVRLNGKKMGVRK